ncbi:MAG TPA: SRPBCC domain-containing protein [Blastocatellia bacterium]|nr:SRPBCC domain-containing protein [Blastocatellia bacterium]
MHDIFQHFPIKASAMQVFDAVSTPTGLDAWWTKSSSGLPELGSEYKLGFGPGYDWVARVSRSDAGREFELEMTSSQEDWLGTRVGFELEEKDGATQVRFHHIGWPESNEHYRVSCYCWSMYLRLLKRYVERGEVVPYEERLDA